MTGSEEGECGACRKPASLRCTACGNVFYCSKYHQKKHWKIHKIQCWPVKEACTEQQGRYLVASLDLKEGDLVLKEKPVVLGPQSISAPFCLGCLKPISVPDFPRCPGCAWPLCTPVCARSPLHEAECKYLATDSAKKGAPQNLEETPRYDVILILRCLAQRTAKPEVWKIIESMVNFADKYKEVKEPYHMASVTYISEVLNGVGSADLIHQVRGAIISNAINVRGPEKQSLRGMYSRIFLLNHSCIPNVTLRADAYGILSIHAAVDIKKGEPLVFSYITPTLPVWERQEELETTYNFSCSCQRCNDPTELSTFFSNPRCPKCCENFLVPTKSREEPWKCQKCDFTKSLKDIIKDDDEYKEKIESSSLTITEASTLLEEMKKIYHEKHYIWFTAAQAILRTIVKDETPEAISMKRILWQRMLTLFLKIEPGSTRRRGVTLYQFACIEFEAVKNEEAQGKFTPREYLAALTAILYRLDSAREIILLEPEDSYEKSWIKLINQEKEKVTKIVEKLSDD